jgi:uncharacterized SAM-binding protein YcdF (DUF218 family)
MRSGIYAGFALVISILAYSAITIYGSVGAFAAGVLFFVVSYILSVLVVMSSRKRLQGDMRFALYQMVFICAVMAMLLAGARLYDLESASNAAAIDNVNAQTAYVSSLNGYYTNYSAYLNDQISAYAARNANLSASVQAAGGTIISPASQPSAGQATTQQASDDYYGEGGYYDD